MNRDWLNEIPALQQTQSRKLETAALEFVNLKIELDKLSRTNIGAQILAGSYPASSRGQTIAPFDFACETLPFFKFTRSELESPKRYKALVPTHMVIGDSWRWRPEHLHATDRARAVDTTYKAFAASNPNYAKVECPEYLFIKPLNIVCAHEGKNRVALFREEVIELIPALVKDEGYPSTDRMRLFALHGIDLAVLDGRFVERANALHLARNLLVAYGIVIEHEWPDQFPALSSVVAALSQQQKRSVDLQHVVDMVELRLDAQAEATEVNATLMEIDAVKLPPQARFLQLCAAIVIVAITTVFTSRWTEVTEILYALLGGMLMLLMIPILPLLRCSVCNLGEPHRTNRLFEFKRAHVRQKAGTQP